MAAYLSTREAYGKALVALGEKYDFYVLDADLAKATQTAVFKASYPQRFFDMGIAEGDMIGTAAGMAAWGKTVFASTFAMFAAGRAYEQIRNSVAYPNLHVIVGATHGGVMIGEDGASHQCIEDLSLMRTVPNMTVIVPCDEASVYAAVEAAIQWSGPVYLRMGRTSSPPVYKGPAEFTIGKGNVLADGKDVAIFALGDLVYEALEARAQMRDQGVDAAVIDMHTVKPLDKELVLLYAEKCGRIITAEDHSIIGGLGSAVAEVLAESAHARLARVGVPDCFGHSGKRSDLQAYFGLNAEGIVAAYQKWKEV